MYDFKAKKILSDKQVLSNILKDVVKEYEGLSFEEAIKLSGISSDLKEAVINLLNA